MNNVIAPRFFGQQLRSGHWSTDGLQLFWRGIQAGNAVDESLYRNHGTILGATWTAGGLDFTDESTDVIQLNRSVPYDDEFTFIVSGIFRSVGGAGVGFFIDWQTGTSLIQFQTGGVIRFTRDHDTTDGIWHSGGHAFNWDTVFAVVSSGTDAPKFFENGIEETFSEQVVPNGALVAQAGATWLGNNYPSRVASLDGTLRYIFIYDRALSTFEIQQLSISPDLPIQQDPVWWGQAVGVTVPVMIHHYKQAGGL